MWFWLSEAVQQQDTRSLTIILLIFPAREAVWNPWLEQAVSFPAWCWNIIHVGVTFLSLLEKFFENCFAGTKPAIAICLVQGPHILSFSCMKRLSSNFIQEWMFREHLLKLSSQQQPWKACAFFLLLGWTLGRHHLRLTGLCKTSPKTSDSRATALLRCS